MMGLRNVRHKDGLVLGLYFFLDIMFVIFVIIFSELVGVGNPTSRLQQESNLGLPRRNRTPSGCPEGGGGVTYMQA